MKRSLAVIVLITIAMVSSHSFAESAITLSHLPFIMGAAPTGPVQSGRPNEVLPDATTISEKEEDTHGDFFAKNFLFTGKTRMESDRQKALLKGLAGQSSLTAFHNLQCVKTTRTTSFKNGKEVSDSWSFISFKANVATYVEDGKHVLRYRELYRGGQEFRNQLSGNDAETNIAKNNGLAYEGGGTIQIRVLASPTTSEQSFAFEIRPVWEGDANTQIIHITRCF